MAYKTISVDVDIDIDDVISDFDSDDLIDELKERGDLPINIGATDSARNIVDDYQCRRMIEMFTAGLITVELMDKLERESNKVIFIG